MLSSELEELCKVSNINLLILDQKEYISIKRFDGVNPKFFMCLGEEQIAETNKIVEMLLVDILDEIILKNIYDDLITDDNGYRYFNGMAIDIIRIGCYEPFSHLVEYYNERYMTQITNDELMDYIDHTLYEFSNDFINEYIDHK